MKTKLIYIGALVCALLLTVQKVESQAPASNASDSVAELKQLMVDNEAILKQQEATLVALDGLLSQAQRIKTQSKR